MLWRALTVHLVCHCIYYEVYELVTTQIYSIICLQIVLRRGTIPIAFFLLGYRDIVSENFSYSFIGTQSLHLNCAFLCGFGMYGVPPHCADFILPWLVGPAHHCEPSSSMVYAPPCHCSSPKAPWSFSIALKSTHRQCCFALHRSVLQWSWNRAVLGSYSDFKAISSLVFNFRLCLILLHEQNYQL